jgi:hypothetical protein
MNIQTVVILNLGFINCVKISFLGNGYNAPFCLCSLMQLIVYTVFQFTPVPQPLGLSKTE